MKTRVVLLVSLFLLVSISMAFATPVQQTIPYTKKTTLAFPKDYTLKFSLCDDPVAGICSYWEEEKIVSMTGSKIKTNLGDTVPFTGVDFSQQYYVQVEKKKKDGTYKMVGARDMLGVVPYAMWSLTGGSGGSGGVTSVTAGTGLLQNATTGDVTLSVDTAILSGVGDITGVTAGTGLTGGGTTGDVTLNVDTAAIQARVSGTCPAGQAIRAIDAAGAVTCQAAGGGGTGYFTVSSVQFMPTDQATTWQYISASEFRTILAPTDRITTLAVAAYLPQGATITEIAATLYDFDTGRGSRLSLFRYSGVYPALAKDELAFVETGVAEAGASDAESVFVKTATLNHTVDLAGTGPAVLPSYILEWTPTNVHGLATFGIISARITYTLP